MTLAPLTANKRALLDERALTVLPGGTTRGLTAASPLAPRAVCGRGYTVFGEEGQRWVDLNNNFTALIHGHAHPDIVRAAVEAVEAGASFGMSTVSEIELAELLVERLPWADQVRFANSGTEAVLAAVRAARVVTGREKIIFPYPSYHGSADSALLALGGVATNGVPSGTKKDVLLVDPFDQSALEAVFAEHGDDIAGYVFDLVPARAGGRPLSTDYVRLARELTQRHGALLIVDEVVSLRHGYSGMAYSQHGVSPDLTTVGKIIGGAHPIGAIVGTRAVMEYFDPRHERPAFHGGTFSGNPVSMRAGIVSMELYTESEVNRLIGLGNRLRDQLNDEIRDFGWEATGYGSSIRFQFTGEIEPAEWKRNLWLAAESRGLLLVPGSLSIALSTPMDEALIDDVAPRIVESFESLRVEAR